MNGKNIAEGMMMGAFEGLAAIELAGKLYSKYCESVGGKAFNGDALPGWEAFSKDPAKKTQRDGWILVAIEARKLVAPI